MYNSKKQLRISLAIAITALFTPAIVNAFYLPGLAPVNFCEEDKASEACKSEVKLYVNKLDSEESVSDLCSVDITN